MNNPSESSAISLPALNNSQTSDPHAADALSCDEALDGALISRQRQRYLASLVSGREAKSDSQYREQ